MKMYHVSTFLSGNPQSETTVSFSLPFCDWCEIEASTEWKDFEKHLEEVQKRDKRYHRSEKERGDAER